MPRSLLLLLLLACRSGTADKYAAGRELAADDLAATVAREKMPGKWRIGPLYWNQTKQQTIGEARLVFAADPTDELAEPPFVAADTLALELGPPPRMLAHVDAQKLREVAVRAGEVDAVVGVARKTLKTLPRYAEWVRRRWRYETRVWLRGATIIVSFDTPDVTDQDIAIEIDLATRQVLSVKLGMA
jgi:hypothetical protein